MESLSDACALHPASLQVIFRAAPNIINPQGNDEEILGKQQQAEQVLSEARAAAQKQIQDAKAEATAVSEKRLAEVKAVRALDPCPSVEFLVWPGITS